MSNYVQWQNLKSDRFNVISGVRQGGILSPYLYIVYVDDMLCKLNNMGCKFYGYSIGAIMYADDLLFMSNSVHQLQCMLNVCQDELDLLDLRINNKKSTCIRIGERFNKQCVNMQLSSGEIKWSKEMKYLGIYIKSNCNLDIDVSNSKAKFFRSSNAILNKLGKFRNNFAAMHLIYTIALPMLTYGLESLRLKNAQIISLENTCKKSLFKIFSTFDKNIIQQCQLHGGVLPFSYLHANRRLNFLRNVRTSENDLIRYIAKRTSLVEIDELCCKFCVNDSIDKHYFMTNYRTVVFNNFMDNVNG